MREIHSGNPLGISREGELTLWLEEAPSRCPRRNELVVRVEAAAAQSLRSELMFGAVRHDDPARSGNVTRHSSRTRFACAVAVMARRLDKLPSGMSGRYGHPAGSEVNLDHRTMVAIRAKPGATPQHQIVKAL